MHTFHALFVLACIATPLCAQGKDVVVRKDGATLRGLEVTEFTRASLKATRKDGSAVEIPGHMVLSVRWGDLPEEFIAGRAAMDRSAFENAKQLFGEAANKAARPLVKSECEFCQLQAAVAAIGADRSLATTTAEKARAWLQANDGHRRLPEALLLAGRAARLGGDAATATTMLRGLDDRASREGFGAVWSTRAKFELALTLEGEGKAGEARSTFQAACAAAASALATPSVDDAELRTIKVQARIGEGETYITEKSYTRAESFFHDLTADADPSLAAAAWAGEGEAIYLAAADSKDLISLRKAQVALARAAILDSQSGDASAKANYYLGRCLLALGADYEGDTFKARAQSYFQIVVAAYGASKWAPRAKAALGE